MTRYAVAFRGHHDSGALNINTFSVDGGGEGNAEHPSDDDVRDEIFGRYVSAYRGCLGDRIHVDELVLRTLDATPQRETGETIDAPGLLSSGSDLPREMSRIITLRTSSPTRSGRGRLFMPVPQNASSMETAETYVHTGTWYDALVTFAQLLETTDDYTYGTLGAFTATLKTLVWSRAHNDSNDVTHAVIRNAVHWLDSRGTIP